MRVGLLAACGVCLTFSAASAIEIIIILLLHRVSSHKDYYGIEEPGKEHAGDLAACACQNHANRNGDDDSIRARTRKSST